MSKKVSTISTFVLAMMNVAVIMSLRGLPLMAKEGLPLIFFLLFAAVVFVIPTSLIAAELATGWPKEGGIYLWVSEAFGNKCGFIAIFLQWIQNVVWYPTVLAFTAGALAYLFLDPALASSKMFNLVVILIVYWGATFLSFKGLKTSGWLSTMGVVCGTILPGVLIIVLGLLWWFLGNPIAFLEAKQSIMPDFGNFSSIAFLAGVVLLFAGMEVSAVHANEVDNPKKNYPKAIFLATIIILVVFSFGSLAIAAVMPQESISLTFGVMEAFKDMFHIFHMDWITPLFGLLIAFGAIGGIVAWIVGPSKGLLATARYGDIHPFLTKINKNGVPVPILIIQGIIVTILALFYVFMPNINTAYFLLTALTAILYLIMYLFMYAAVIKLRYSKPNIKRAYKIPGGLFGVWLVAGIAILGVIFAIIVGLYPPSQLQVKAPLTYVLFLVCGIAVFVATPLIMLRFRRDSWKNINNNKG